MEEKVIKPTPHCLSIWSCSRRKNIRWICGSAIFAIVASIYKVIRIIIIFISTAFSHVKTIHVYVTLADNGQGIVSSNESLENGSDLYHNQYWGALYGVKQFFEKSHNWELIDDDVFTPNLVLKRLVFRHKSQGAYLIADAYSGSYDQLRATNDMFRSLSGWHNNFIMIDDPDKGEI